MTMMSKCANPNCSVPFDHRCGRFFRFHRPHAPNEKPANHHSVWHFWLCGECSETYTLESRGSGVRVCRRLSQSSRKSAMRETENVPS